jgi:hypothetical protein
MPAVGSKVTVTGISVTTMVNGNLVSMLRLRSQDDITGLDGAVISGRITSTTMIDQLIESPHPCPDNYNQTWHIAGPEEAAGIRLHFTKIEIIDGSHWNNLSYTNPDGSTVYLWNYNDYWTDWIMSNSIDLVFAGSGSYGFQIDKCEAMFSVVGATVTLEPGSIKTTTDEDGYYIFSGLEPGTYIVTPSLEGTTFIPSTRSIDVHSSQSVAEINFSTN